LKRADGGNKRGRGENGEVELKRKIVKDRGEAGKDWRAGLALVFPAMEAKT